MTSFMIRNRVGELEPHTRYESEVLLGRDLALALTAVLHLRPLE